MFSLLSWRSTESRSWEEELDCVNVRLLDRLASSFLNRSLRIKLTLSVVLPLVLILGTFTAIQYARYRRSVLDNLSLLTTQTSLIIENSLQHAMLSRNRDELQHTLDAIGENEMLQVVYLMDPSGKVVFAPKGEGVGMQLDNSEPSCLTCHSVPADERPSSVVITLPDGNRIFRSMNPIENHPPCYQCHDPEERLLGLLLTDTSMAPLEVPLASSLRENLIWWIATILVTVLVAYLAVNRFVIRRLEGLSTAISELGDGQFPPKLAETQPDEIGQLAGVFNAMSRRVKSREEENRKLSDKLRRQSLQRAELLKRQISAQENERKRVARELHDVLGQALSGLAFQFEAMRGLINSDPERAQSQLTKNLELINGTTEQMYDLILDLRPSTLDDLGLPAALRTYAERLFAGTGIAYEIDSTGMYERVQSEVETALYRIFQEALSNIMRHSGAEHVYIKLSRHDSIFEGEILDDGHGFDLETVETNGEAGRGLGLLGMQERAAECGGHLEIISGDGNGTIIRVRIPLKKRANG